MGLQDDIFDLQHHLEGTQYEEAFDNLYSAFCAAERQVMEMEETVRTVNRFRELLTMYKEPES